MIKQCEYKTCSNFFTLGRKTKFCSTRCNLNSGRQAWKQRNAGTVIAGERKRRKKRYAAAESANTLRMQITAKNA